MLNILLSIGTIWLLYKLFRFYLKIFYLLFKDAFKRTNEEINQEKAWNAFVLTNFERSEKLVRTGVAAIAGLAKVCSCFLIRFAHILK